MDMNNIRIYDLRDIANIEEIARHFDNDDARGVGIYITANELRYYQSAQWIKAYVFTNKNILGGFMSANLSEQIWGRGILNEFYIFPPQRGNRLTTYRFYRWCMDNVFPGCYRITGYVHTNNKVAINLMKRLGWKQECVIKKYTVAGDKYIQYSINGGGIRS